MNDLHVWEDRKQATINLMSDEMKVLEAGYNPITDQQIIDALLIWMYLRSRLHLTRRWIWH
ncbi:hypothetical protein [Arachidicoccus terrestris]|uniref:hypothetical protein n=1 Tax=Arachidicoccus terrestris TaxID=2875539 RepID=UPI001CC37A48|nr:hypothetical protein [Arachidicoccus terrestris]UAY55940.1 hypothetical protein K9M52_02585 [Arachidicoccus terrestris]